MTACGWTMVRAPMTASVADRREGADVAAGADDRAGRHVGRRRHARRQADRRARAGAAAQANARYGSRARSIAHGAGAASSATMTAEARVAATCDAYLGLARNDRSPGPAASSVATRPISIEPSPSSRHPRRPASSRRVKRREYITGLRGPSARRTGPDAAGSGARRSRARAPPGLPASCRAGAAIPPAGPTPRSATRRA